jgi:hypothetical protein
MHEDYDPRRRALERYDARLKELQAEYLAAVEHARAEYRDDLIAIRFREKQHDEVGHRHE